MPTYEYACRECAQHLEVVQSFKDEALTTCGACGGPLRKVFSAAGIIFKGSGYYVTDTRDKVAARSSATGASKGTKDTKEDAATPSPSSESGSGDSGAAETA